MSVDAQSAPPFDPRADSAERFRLEPDELRFVADWVSPAEAVWAELPTDVAGLIRQRRTEGRYC